MNWGLYRVVIPERGLATLSFSARGAYHAAESLRREGAYEGKGLTGYKLVSPAGKIFFSVKSGEEMTLEEAEPSVRLYNAITRRLLTIKKLPENGITIGYLRKLVIGEELLPMKGAGTKTVIELFELLVKYTGVRGLEAAGIKALYNTPTNIGRAWLKSQGIIW